MKFLIVTVLWALALAAVWEKVDVYRTGYAIEQLRHQKKQLQDQQRALELELATATSPEQIERLATARLGMVRARADQVVVIAPARKPEGVPPAKGLLRVAHPN